MAENMFNQWEQIDSSDRLELVFADRFKGYGAYVIRKQFKRGQVIATLSACLFALLAASTPYILNAINGQEEETKTVKLVVTNLDDVEAPEEEEEKPDEPPPIEEPEPIATQAYAVPEINEDATEDSPINPPDLVQNAGLQDQAGSDDFLAPDMNTGGGSGPFQGDDGPKTKVDIRAEFPGGEQAFRDYVKYEFIYPIRCQDEGINGSVNLRFIVDKTGRISNIQVLEETKSCPEFTQEAIRVLKASKRWIPAQVNGNFTTAWRELPIKLAVQ